MKGYKTVDDYIKGPDQWRDELAQFRSVPASTDLTEELKWGPLCHTFEANRDETNVSRIKKILPIIRSGIGLSDRYRC